MLDVTLGRGLTVNFKLIAHCFISSWIQNCTFCVNFIGINESWGVEQILDPKFQIVTKIQTSVYFQVSTMSNFNKICIYIVCLDTTWDQEWAIASSSVAPPPPPSPGGAYRRGGGDAAGEAGSSGVSKDLPGCYAVSFCPRPALEHLRGCLWHPGLTWSCLGWRVTISRHRRSPCCRPIVLSSMASPALGSPDVAALEGVDDETVCHVVVMTVLRSHRLGWGSRCSNENINGLLWDTYTSESRCMSVVLKSLTLINCTVSGKRSGPCQSHCRGINNKTSLVVEIIRDMIIVRRKFENNKSLEIFETKI